jgi:hypothetical protein
MTASIVHNPVPVQQHHVQSICGALLSLGSTCFSGTPAWTKATTGTPLTSCNARSLVLEEDLCTQAVHHVLLTWHHKAINEAAEGPAEQFPALPANPACERGTALL